jgi:phytoene dehydrogenase-like protein
MATSCNSADPATPEVVVVGAGLAGLIAAIECAGRGARVQVLEARTRAGGRARSTPPPYIANLVPHALYTGGSL